MTRIRFTLVNIGLTIVSGVARSTGAHVSVHLILTLTIVLTGL